MRVVKYIFWFVTGISQISKRLLVINIKVVSVVEFLIQLSKVSNIFA